MAKNTSFPPIKDGVKADNTTYSSNKIEEIVSTVESEIPVLPEPAVGDINKVIGITSDGSTGAKYGLISIENELPAPSSSNAGKIAKVVSDGEGGYAWSAEDESTELPAPEAADIGKIVSVVSDGSTGAEYGLADAPSGGAEFLEVPLVKNGSTWNIDSSVTLQMLEDAYNAGKMFLLSFTENAIGVTETKRIIADVSYTEGVGFNMTGAFVSMTRSGNTITHVYSNEFIITAMSFATSVALFTVELAKAT